jgi:hypothetical protein
MYSDNVANCKVMQRNKNKKASFAFSPIQLELNYASSEIMMKEKILHFY